MGLFFFKGLGLQGIYSERSGVYSAAEKVFGELMSPNKILPQWIKSGICHLLYRIYTGDWRKDPYYTALFENIELPDINDVSHHPEKWPGNFSYRDLEKTQVLIFVLHRKIISFLTSYPI